MNVTRTPLLTAQLGPAKITGRVEAQHIAFGPGQASPLHLHPCPVVGYVAKGSVLFQVQGQEPKVLQAGEAFFEPDNTPVAHFDNASADAPMEFVAFYLMARESEAKLVILP